MLKPFQNNRFLSACGKDQFLSHVLPQWRACDRGSPWQPSGAGPGHDWFSLVGSGEPWHSQQCVCCIWKPSVSCKHKNQSASHDIMLASCHFLALSCPQILVCYHKNRQRCLFLGMRWNVGVRGRDGSEKDFRSANINWWTCLLILVWLNGVCNRSRNSLPTSPST